MVRPVSVSKEELVAQAEAEGFSLVRVAPLIDMPDHYTRLRAYLEAGRHGSMAWMEDRHWWRGDPAALWPEAKSAIMLGEVYTPEGDALANLAHPEIGNISVYARHKDYHDLVKKRLKRVARWLIDQTGGPGTSQVKVFVDTAPVPEKALGALAGLGWQ
ncbi:MAG: QueG-associated DUF1730 domain-containing protein, partial [Pseudomonadota bacterium]